MQLSPLQSRLVASLAATLCLAALYFLLSFPKGALAAEFSPDSSWTDLVVFNDDNTGTQTSLYAPIFDLFSRSILERALSDVTPLQNNKPLALNLASGTTACYIIKKGSLFTATLASNDNGQTNASNELDGGNNGTIYISANTCLQPSPKDTTKTSAPQLTLWVSNSTNAAECPKISNGVNSVDPEGFVKVVFEEGAATLSINGTNDVYVGISAPALSNDYEGSYNFEVAASGNDYFHQHQANGTGAELLWMDSDSTSALLVTQNLTTNVSEVDQIMSQPPPYQLFVTGAETVQLNGLRQSACGLRQNAFANYGVPGTNKSFINTAITLRGPGGLPKQQFYVVGLNATTAYTGILVRPASAQVNSRKRASDSSQDLNSVGSFVYKPTTFQTNAAPNCKVVTDLDFCTEIQYAVPGNDNKYNNTELAKAYDKYASEMYDNFLKVMQQIQCDADRTSKYSLVRSCDDCRTAYKRWLCTVSIPRCEDFLGGSAAFSVIRNVGQAFPNGTMLPDSLQQSLGRVPSHNVSRNIFIDEQIQPGPYREILPCDDICYQVVQSCPANIGFKCPRPGHHGFNGSYGIRDGNRSMVSCNFPGEARTPVGGTWAMMPNLTILAGIFCLSSLLITLA